MKLMQNKYKIQLRLEKFFIEELWQHLIIVAFIFMCARVSGRYIEAILFTISHTVVRQSFNKQYHCGSTAFCIITTFTVMFFGIAYMLPLNVSLLSAIPMGFAISSLGYIVQDRIDLRNKVKELESYTETLLFKINHKDIYAMNADELYEHCRSCGLDEEDCRVAYFIVYERLKGKELYEAISYSKRQTIRKRKEILDKIK